MKQTRNKISGIKVAYIGGGSRGWAWTFMTDLAKEKQISGSVYLYDIDKDASKANEIIGNHLTSRAESVGKWSFQSVNTLQEALTGADFVIISILPKTFDEMEVDVHMPERLGIYQSVGDTAGPGGIMRALRTIPMFVEFAKAIRTYCPNAWVINYTNPMSVCVKTLYYEFPAIKAFGCCHEVFGTQKFLASVVKEELGITKVTKDDIKVNVLGINHFTWFDHASYQSYDVIPLYKAFIDKHYETGFEEVHDNWMNSTFSCAHRVKMDLFKNYGLIAAAGDRHLAEFMPGETYLKDPQTVAKWKFGLTTVAWRKEDLSKRLERSKRLADGTEELDLSKDTGEEGIKLIKAICGLDNIVTNVNIPNSGKQIANLPEDAVVETNALFERDAIRPVIAGSLPDNILALVTPHVTNHRRVIEAVYNNNTDLVIEAFENDPLVKGRAKKSDIKALVKDMMKATL